MNVDVRVLFNRIPEIERALPGGVADVINRGILVAEAAAIPLVPVDTGALRSNRTTEFATAASSTATLTFNQDYAAFVEFGTVRMPGRLFASRGLDQAMPGVEADLRRLVEG